MQDWKYIFVLYDGGGWGGGGYGGTLFEIMSVMGKLPAIWY